MIVDWSVFCFSFGLDVIIGLILLVMEFGNGYLGFNVKVIQ